MAKKTAQDQTIEELREFQGQVLDLLKSYQKNRLIDAESRDYQTNLEKLLKQINTAVATNGPISKRDAAHMSKQLELAEKSYSSMKDQHAGDRKFQEQFIKTFGKEPLEGSLTKSIAQTFGKSMSQFSKTFGAATQPIRKNAVETAMFELTGPFGAFVKQTINTDAIKQYFQERKQNKQQAKEYRKQKYQDTSGDLNSSVKGIFAGGSENVPATGSYYLHKGERVVAPEQNKDLSEFLSGMKNQHSAGGSDFLRDIDDNVKKANRLIEEELADSYFDPILENDDRLFIIGQKDKFRFNKRLFENLETIELGIFNVGQSLYGFMIRTSLFFKRFLRHPIFYSLDYLFEPVFMGLRGIYREFFGKKRSEEQELKESVDNIYEFLVDQERKSHKTFGQQILKRFVNSVVGAPFNALAKLMGGKAFTLRNAQRTQEEIELHGHARGLQGVMQRLHLMGFGDYLKYGKRSKEAEENDERYRPNGYMRDMRYAGLHAKDRGIRGMMRAGVRGWRMLGLLDEHDMAADGLAPGRNRDARGRFTKGKAADGSSVYGRVLKDIGATFFGPTSFIGKGFKMIGTGLKKIFNGIFTAIGGFVSSLLGPMGIGAVVAAIAGLKIGSWLHDMIFGKDGAQSPAEQRRTDLFDKFFHMMDKFMLFMFKTLWRWIPGSGDMRKDLQQRVDADDANSNDAYTRSGYMQDKDKSSIADILAARKEIYDHADHGVLNSFQQGRLKDLQQELNTAKADLAEQQESIVNHKTPAGAGYATNGNIVLKGAVDSGPDNRLWAGSMSLPRMNRMLAQSHASAEAAAATMKEAGKHMAHSAKQMEKHVKGLTVDLKHSIKHGVQQAPAVIHDMQTVATMHGIGFDPQH